MFDNFRFDRFMFSLQYMWKGMLCIFAVIGVLVLSVLLMNRLTEKMEALIRKLVRSKLNDGQLDESDLTFIDLERICTAFSTVLTGVFHERIEYPEVNLPPRMDIPAPANPETGDAPANDGAAVPKPSEQGGQ